jgi:hypothetical protein
MKATKSCENVKESNNTKVEALNCIEHLLVLDEISVDKYELLRKVIEMFDEEDIIVLGDGIAIKLVDEEK